MATKPPVLVVAGRYRPGYRSGGPVASIENLVAALGGEFDFRVLTFDRDVGDEAPFPAEGRRAEAVYLTPETAFGRLRSELRAARGVVYVQTLFDPLWGVLPLMQAPRERLLISPRGQLAPGALNYGRAKKRAGLALMRMRDLGNALWQATAESDAAEIRAAVPWVDPEKIVLAPNLPSDPGFVVRRKPPGRLKALYVGRIDPKKNLLTAIRAAGAAGVDLEVVGPAEDAAYAEACRQAANDRVTFTGPLPPDEVRRRLHTADAFLFPTYGENYGHSIVEAMLSGLPGVIGATTPWRDLESRRAGYDLPPDDVERFAHALRTLAGMAEAEYQDWSQGARETMVGMSQRDQAVEASRRMLLRASGIAN